MESGGTREAVEGGAGRCPLCGGAAAGDAARDMLGRRLGECGTCGLVFAGERDWPDAEREKARYGLHRNTAADAGYVRFLRKTLAPALRRLPPGGRMLDFGSGPVPVMAELARAEGVRCEAWDPFFAPERPSGTFDVVTACEVVEHFHRVREGWADLLGFAGERGTVVVATEILGEGLEGVGRWSYAGDFTHTAFYRERTLAWIAERAGRRLATEEAGRVYAMVRGQA